MTPTTVKTYRNAKAFSKDAPRMARKGYQVAATYQEPSKNKPLRNLLKVPVGGTLLWGSSIKGGKVVVTYQAGLWPLAAQPMLPAAVMAPPLHLTRPRAAGLARAFLLSVAMLIVLPLVLVLVGSLLGAH